MPRSDPIHDARNDLALRNAIYNQISRSHIVIIPTGMYAHYSKWIRKEIDGAKYYGKPILAVNPHGQQRVAGVVAAAADQTVNWSSNSIVGEFGSSIIGGDDG